MKRQPVAEIVRVSRWQYHVHVRFQVEGHQPVEWMHRGYVSEHQAEEAIKVHGWRELPSSQWQRLQERRAAA
jgi:hypothetical protein